MKKSILMVLVILSGCGGWSKPGATQQEFARDKYQCQMEAQSAYPARTSSTPIYSTPTRTNCQSYGQTTDCTTTPGKTLYQQSGDENMLARSLAVNSCLEARGYTFSMSK